MYFNLFLCISTHYELPRSSGTTTAEASATKAAKVSAALVNEFIDKSHALWENHPINVKRAKEGKLKKVLAKVEQLREWLEKQADK